jgi:hypothetical protein
VSVERKKFGGVQEGAGRPPIPEELKKVQIGLALPRWLIGWLDTKPESRAQVIEDALCKVHKIKPPKV